MVVFMSKGEPCRRPPDPFLAAQSSSRSLVVGTSVRRSGYVCEKVTFRESKRQLKSTFLPTYDTVVTVVIVVTVVTLVIVMTAVTVVTKFSNRDETQKLKL